MNRREMLSAVAGVAAAANVQGEAQAIDAEPRPLLLVFRLAGRLKSEAKACIREQWESIREHNPGLPILVVIDGGATLEAVLDPRSK